MPSIIETLALENQTLVTVTENDSAQHALSRMIEHDFSQLPVVDEAQKLKGMITSDSILRAVSYFKVVPEKLKVSHALIVKARAKAHLDEEKLPDLLRDLRDTSAIPILDRDRKVVAIVTSYDIADYYRHRSADLMLAENIEQALRDLILAASASDADEPDNDAMTQLIQASMPSDKEQKKRFKTALITYINKQTNEKHVPDTTLLEAAFDQHLKESAPQKTFKKLTLAELIRIVKSLWHTHQANFNDMAWDVMGPLLDDVRKTRNAIAHFDEVTDEQRKRLQFCAEFLENHRPTVESPEIAAHNDLLPRTFLQSSEIARIAGNTAISFATKHLKTAWDIRTSAEDNAVELTSFNPPAEELEANDSRYAPLAIWLQAQEEDRVTCTFKEIETIILQEDLPPSARQHRNWWANDTVSHTQSAQWIEVGWRVSSVNMSTERVVFSRMGDRQSAHIDFFTHLQARLQTIEGLSISAQSTPQGRHWLELTVSPKNYDTIEPFHLTFAFNRRSRFRIDTFINEGGRGQNKQIFDQLQAQKAEIETKFGAVLTWEELHHRRGYRIAYYRSDSAVTDTPENLNQIQDWAVEVLPRFYNALSDRFAAAKKKLCGEEER